MKSKLVRAPVLGACVAAFAAVASAQADETVSTVSYNVTPGTCSNPIAVPVNNRPVLVMGTGFNTGEEGVGETALLRANSSPALLDWAGTSVWANINAISPERGWSENASVHIMWISYSGYVDLQTAGSTHVMVCNSSGSPLAHATGYLTFIY
ncbi:MAG TPA: hypothetical protein VGM17_04880 [Rhizomicrobium sp.]|jgi:hypothetical protein